MGFAYLTFECVQALVLFCTLGSGFLTLLFLFLDDCKHTVPITILVTMGLVHELYCVSVLNNLKALAYLNLLDLETDGCRSLYTPGLLSNTVMVLVFTWCVIDNNFKLQNKGVVKFAFLFLSIIAVQLLTTFAPVTKPDQEPSFDITPESNLSVYFTICRIDLGQNYMNFIGEYILIYLPFLCLVGIACYFTSYINGAPYGTKFIMLSPCTSSTDCARCQMTNYSVTMMVNYFMVAIFVVRPWMIVYSVSNNSPLLDLIPNLMNTVLYTYISLEYITNFYWVKHSNVKR